MPYAVLAVVLLAVAACTKLGRKILVGLGRTVIGPAAALLCLAAVHWFSGRAILPQQLAPRRYARHVHAVGRSVAVLLAVATAVFGPLLVLLVVLVAGAGVTGVAAVTRSRTRVPMEPELDRSPIRVKASIGAPAEITD